MNDHRHQSGTIDPRLRVKELLRIPDQERTAAQWDELAELEHALATGNRIATTNKPASGAKPAFGDKPSFGEKPSFGDKPATGKVPDRTVPKVPEDSPSIAASPLEAPRRHVTYPRALSLRSSGRRVGRPDR